MMMRMMMMMMMMMTMMTMMMMMMMSDGGGDDDDDDGVCYMHLATTDLRGSGGHKSIAYISPPSSQASVVSGACVDTKQNQANKDRLSKMGMPP